MTACDNWTTISESNFVALIFRRNSYHCLRIVSANYTTDLCEDSDQRDSSLQVYLCGKLDFVGACAPVPSKLCNKFSLAKDLK